MSRDAVPFYGEWSLAVIYTLIFATIAFVFTGRRPAATGGPIELVRG